MTPLPHTSSWQVAEQPSPDVVPPSSHCSLHSTMRSPHWFAGLEQSLAQEPAHWSRLPSSQTSPSSGCTTPSPQRGGAMLAHCGVQVRDPPGPSSHCSLHSGVPLPHASVLHCADRPSPSQDRSLPASPSSSHSLMPSPQSGLGRLQSAAQFPTQASLLPSSQASPHSLMPSPQTSSTRVHVELQPSQSLVLPSSQASEAALTPSPQRTVQLHTVLQVVPAGQLPAAPSHCSP